MGNNTLFKAIQEMVKQFENIKDEDKYREECIKCVYNTFSLDMYDAEIIYDLAVFWEWLYLADNDAETEFNIKYNEDWTFTASEYENNWDYKKAFIFNAIPVKLVLQHLDELAREERD